MRVARKSRWSNIQPIKAEEKKAKKNFLGKLYRDVKIRFGGQIKEVEKVVGRYAKDKKVVLKQNALIKALVYYALIDREQKGKEVMGLLVGKRENGTATVEDAYICDQHVSGCNAEIDYVKFAELIKKAKQNNVTTLGWWHSHPFGCTNPSGEDTHTNSVWEKMGIKEPIMLIVCDRNFWLGTTVNGHAKKLEFEIPAKTDDYLDLNIGYATGNYHTYTPDGAMAGYCYGSLDDFKFVTPFFGWVGDRVITAGRYVLPIVFNYIHIGSEIKD